MNPIIANIISSGDIMTFTLSGVNVSLANALRRTIHSDIQTVVFRTTPYEENKANITVNTSRLNNEVIKQRLSCIPIHITDLRIPIKDYILEIDEENLTDTIRFITTEHFKIKNIKTDTYLSEQDTRAIFPPNEYNYYIDFVRLRPKLYDEMLGEKLKLTCEFSIGTAKEDGMFNATSTCAYGFTKDQDRIREEEAILKQKLKDKNLKEDEILVELADWHILDACRIYLKDSFDFIIETVGVFSNEELVQKACDILMMKLSNIDTLIESDELEIVPSQNTMENSYDIILQNEDYTIGKVIEYMLYSKFFDTKVLNYCGFKKMHPHDEFSVIRISYVQPVEKTVIRQHLKVCIIESVGVFAKIKKSFSK